jgi:hypothetical protein
MSKIRIEKLKFLYNMKDDEGNKWDNILDEVEEVVVLIPLNISEEMLLIIFQFDKEVKIVR